MSTPKVIRAAQSLLQQVRRTSHRLTKELVSWLLRGLLIIGRQPLLSKAGFVLPTTVLLLLVVVLTVGAISYRTFTRSQQAITGRQQQVVYNAATPVIDRAKSKLEFLFDTSKDTRGGGVPSQEKLLGMLLNDGKTVPGVPHFPFEAPDIDPYTFGDEERVDVNGDGKVDNAWRYRVDLDGDGNTKTAGNKDGWAVYSIIFTAPDDPNALLNSKDTAWEQRASQMLVRNAPLSNANPNEVCKRDYGGGEEDSGTGPNEEGWFPDPSNRSKIRKNFQVNAYVVPDNANGTVATLEFQQDREATRGFKWAAWFRNDLEIYPGPAFNWNGAMHTEGSLVVGGGAKFRGYLVSSPSSCITSPDASQITLKENEADKPIKGTPAFKGRFIAGTLRDNDYSNSKPKFDISVGGNIKTVEMNDTTDSVKGSLKPLDFSLEPVKLQTEGFSEARNPDAKPANPDAFEDGKWRTSELAVNRMKVDPEVVTPYLDDTFRADNRWGPKPKWGPKGLPIGVTSEENAGGGSTVKIGEPIQGVQELTGSDPAPGTDNASVGLDGYWERRARVEGLRLIVGQRLELGDPAGWGGPGGTSGVKIGLENEPLRPWDGSCMAGVRCNEERQRKNLWDNLSSVQATAVYHNATDTTADARDFPDACLVTTVHPGTPTTLDRSATFENLAYGFSGLVSGYDDATVISDFFRGRGTNGWEFSVPKQSDFSNKNSELMKALRNLAYFAGDPKGGAPSFQPIQVAGQQVHPYPSMAMWGDFSMLRNVFRLLDGGATYESLSPADKTTLHTAGCTLGMLAYNLDYLEKLTVYNPNPALDPTRSAATPEIRTLMGYTDTELLEAGKTELTLDNTLMGNLNYSQGLRGHIRVIDHIGRGYINSTNYTNINVANQPPLAFVKSLDKVTSDAAMETMMWSARGSNDPEGYVRLLERWRDYLPAASPQRDELNKMIYLAQLIITKEQVARDRIWGFQGAYGNSPSAPAVTDVGYVNTWPLGDCGYSLLSGGNPALAGWLNEASVPLKAKKVGSATFDTIAATDPFNRASDPLSRFCSHRPRFPILYSLFPARLANAEITAAAPVPADLNTAYGGLFLGHQDISGSAQEDQRTRDAEDRFPKFAKYIINENGGLNYAVIRPSNIATKPLRLSQSGITLGSGGDWVLPHKAGTPATGTTPDSNRYNLIKICGNNAGQRRCSEPDDVLTTYQKPRAGTLVRVAFKDAAFYNGREMLPVRTLDLDLDLMRETEHKDDLWLPQKGIIYAYREDAVSEAHIVRPNSGNTWTDCNTDADLQSTTCAIQTADKSAYDSKDPPVNADNAITPKPVDYYPDPDRRPYGFRLRQGSSLKREGDEGRGLSFVSDNPVYIQGDFNLHQDSGGQPLEEFTQPLQYTVDASSGDVSISNFYTRTTIDLSFANPNKDQWRPAEVVADAVTLLSSNFCDGSIEDGLSNIGAKELPAWLQNRYNCGQANVKVTSYLNQNRPKDKVSNNATGRGVLWVRRNLADSHPRAVTEGTFARSVDEGESPIFVFRNGKPVHWKDQTGATMTYAGNYIATQDDRLDALIKATDETRMNLIVVSGLVPSREGQSYGGLHNFPRFIENWKAKRLYISGAFLQLNFSNYATAPFDQEAWQPGAPAPQKGSGNTVQWIRYYDPPNRLWGYDVALQYAAPGPVAERFQFPEDIRSEFYSEPSAADPYVRNLCVNGLKGVTPNVNCPT